MNSWRDSDNQYHVSGEDTRYTQCGRPTRYMIASSISIELYADLVATKPRVNCTDCAIAVIRTTRKAYTEYTRSVALQFDIEGRSHFHGPLAKLDEAYTACGLPYAEHSMRQRVLLTRGELPTIDCNECSEAVNKAMRSPPKTLYRVDWRLFSKDAPHGLGTLLEYFTVKHGEVSGGLEKDAESCYWLTVDQLRVICNAVSIHVATAPGLKAPCMLPTVEAITSMCREVKRG